MPTLIQITLCPQGCPLKPGQLLALAFIDAHARDAGGFKVTQSLLARNLGVARKTANQYVASLERRGYLRSIKGIRSGGGNDANTYSLTPAGLQAIGVER